MATTMAKKLTFLVDNMIIFVQVPLCLGFLFLLVLRNCTHLGAGKQPPTQNRMNQLSVRINLLIEINILLCED